MEARPDPEFVGYHGIRLHVCGVALKENKAAQRTEVIPGDA